MPIIILLRVKSKPSAAGAEWTRKISVLGERPESPLVLYIVTPNAWGLNHLFFSSQLLLNRNHTHRLIWKWRDVIATHWRSHHLRMIVAKSAHCRQKALQPPGCVMLPDRREGAFIVVVTGRRHRLFPHFLALLSQLQTVRRIELKDVLEPLRYEQPYCSASAS